MTIAQQQVSEIVGHFGRDDDAAATTLKGDKDEMIYAWQAGHN